MTGRNDHPRFSMLEIVVVLVILGLVLALALPRIGRLPRRLVIERALSTLRSAFRDAGMKARATGKPVGLVLDVEKGVLRLEDVPGFASPGVSAPSPADTSAAEDEEADGDEGAQAPKPAGFLARLGDYRLPADLKWDEFEAAEAAEGDGDAKEPAFSFFPGGEASGQPLTFAIRGHRFRLDVDRLTGRPLIEERSD